MTIFILYLTVALDVFQQPSQDLGFGFDTSKSFPSYPEAITVGAAVTMIFLALYGLIFRVILPAWAKRKAASENLLMQRSKYRFEEEKKDDLLGRQAKEFMTELAKENISSVRHIAESAQEELKNIRKQNIEYLLELGSLRAKDLLREQEVERMREEIKEVKEAAARARETQVLAQEELLKLRSLIISMQEQIDVLRTELRMERLEKTKLIEELKNKDFEIKAMRGEIAALTEKSLQRQEEISVLRNKLLEYRNAFKQAVAETEDRRTPPTGDTEELIKRTGGNVIEIKPLPSGINRRFVTEELLAAKDSTEEEESEYHD